MYETKKDDSAPAQQHQKSIYTNPAPEIDFALTQHTKNKNNK